MWGPLRSCAGIALLNAMLIVLSAPGAKDNDPSALAAALRLYDGGSGPR